MFHRRSMQYRIITICSGKGQYRVRKAHGRRKASYGKDRQDREQKLFPADQYQHIFS